MILSSCRLRKSLTVVLGLGLITIPMMMGSKCKIQFGNEATRVIRGSQTPVKKQYFSGTGSGVLQAESKRGAWLGECPLLSTDVDASVAGYVSQVSVKQRFKNTFSQSIEAVYTFPLPENAAVDEMIMHVGNRVIRGSIKTREAARKSY